jgi:hypothetical protein
MKGDKRCPNFQLCRKMIDPSMKACSSCFWEFNNEVVEFKDDMECPVCYETKKCVKFRKCTHFVCLKCFDKVENCPMCRSDPDDFSKLKKAGLICVRGE